ncbi:hypothetical protein ACK8OR_17780 [Jannaschia sp. KMU-145]|uniref:hypothetical protein n=1 Tax=Jannaschia halovivens TaxID=3388667 RepID=UPI00396B1B9C
MVLLSQLFAIRGDTLNSNSVDAIYYTAAIAGAALYYVSEIPIREVTDKENEVSAAENSLESARVLVDDLDTQILRLSAGREIALNDKKQFEEELADPLMRSVQEAERDLAPQLASVAFVSPEAEQVRARASVCELEIVPSANALKWSLVAEQRLAENSLGGETPGTVPLVVDMVQIQIGALDSQIAACETDITRARPIAGRAASVETYSALSRVWQTLGNTANEVIDIPDFAVIDGEARGYHETLALVRSYVGLTGKLRQAGSFEAALADEGNRVAALQVSASADLLDAESTLKKRNAELAEIEARPIRNAIRAASSFVANYWPFCLIVLLGLKLGREPMFSVERLLCSKKSQRK